MQAGLAAELRLINGPSGAIGSSLPMGMAAMLRYPERNVFVFMGTAPSGTTPSRSTPACATAFP